VGRVTPSRNFRESHSRMKWDVGLGIRGMMRKFVGRIDFSVSEQGVALGHIGAVLWNFQRTAKRPAQAEGAGFFLIADPESRYDRTLLNSKERRGNMRKVVGIRVFAITVV
jgi:hypothetical protein